MSRDSIEIDGLQLSCIVGVRPEERDHEQSILLDVALGLDLGNAGRSSRISETESVGPKFTLVSPSLPSAGRRCPIAESEC